MISRRNHFFFSLPACGLLLPLLTVACEKVPLLAPTGSTIVLTASANALPTNGTTDIIGQVLEAAGTPPHSGTVISFTTTLGSIEPADARTDVSGRVVVKFRAGLASGSATIVATSGGATTGPLGAVKIAVGSAAVARINVTANPGVVPAAGGASTIVANVADINGNVLPNVSVSFATDAGSLGAAAVNTDQNGNAQTTLTTNKTAKVTASAGVTTTGTGTAQATTAQSATVTVNVNVVAAITVGSPSPTAPTAGQSVTFSVSQATGGSAIQRTVVDWGDGSSQAYAGLPSSVSHAFGAPGSYSVRVSATDTFGDVAPGANAVTVTPRSQVTVGVTKTAPPDPLTVAVAVTFTIAATATPGSVIASVSVNFGDGVTVTLTGGATQVTHKYALTGSYTVTATVTDSSGATGSGSTVIFVNP